MSKWRFTGFWVLAVGWVAMMLATGVPAGAALGGNSASIQADQIHMQGIRRTTAAQSYTVNEIQATSGTVREYASTSGTVFAVSWHGPWMPDMRQLLGSYFDQYVQAAKAQSVARRGRRPLLITQPGLTVQLGGHSRSFAGRAYVPEMLPQGVRTEDIQ